MVCSLIIFSGKSGKASRDLDPLVSPLNSNLVSCKSSCAAVPISGYLSPRRGEGKDREVLPVMEPEDGRRGTRQSGTKKGRMKGRSGNKKPKIIKEHAVWRRKPVREKINRGEKESEEVTFFTGAIKTLSV